MARQEAGSGSGAHSASSMKTGARVIAVTPVMAEPTSRGRINACDRARFMPFANEFFVIGPYPNARCFPFGRDGVVTSIGKAVVDLMRSIAKREVTLRSGIVAVSRL